MTDETTTTKKAGLSPIEVGAGAGAAVITAFASSYLGTAGTLTGAAIASVVGTVSTSVLRNSARTSADRWKQTTTRLRDTRVQHTRVTDVRPVESEDVDPYGTQLFGASDWIDPDARVRTERDRLLGPTGADPGSTWDTGRPDRRADATRDPGTPFRPGTPRPGAGPGGPRTGPGGPGTGPGGPGTGPGGPGTGATRPAFDAAGPWDRGRGTGVGNPGAEATRRGVGAAGSSADTRPAGATGPGAPWAASARVGTGTGGPGTGGTKSPAGPGRTDLGRPDAGGTTPPGGTGPGGAGIARVAHALGRVRGRWVVMGVGAVAAFTLALGAITGIEAVAGKPLSGLAGQESGGGTTIGRATGGDGNSGGTTPSPTPTPTTGGSATPTAPASDNAPSVSPSEPSGPPADSPAPSPSQAPSQAPTQAPAPSNPQTP